MASIRIGFSSDFVLKNGVVGLGTTVGTSTGVAGTGNLRVDNGALKGNFSVTGVATLTAYGGFVAQKQHVNKPAAIGFGTVGLQTAGVGTAYQYYETETGFTDLGGVQHGDDLYYNTLSEDLIVDDGQILNISSIDMVGVTTIGESDPHSHQSHVCAGALESVSVQSNFSVPCGGIEARKENPIEGTVRFNDDLNTLEFYNGVEWRQFTVTGASGRAVFGGGDIPGGVRVSTIDFVNIQTKGNSKRFGDLTQARSDHNRGVVSSSSRGIFAGGSIPPTTYTTIDYITIASEGNAIDFGDTGAAAITTSACSSSTRGLFAGGYSPSLTNVIEYIEISTIGNALDFGDLSNARTTGSGFASPTRGVFGGGTDGSVSNKIDFVTISSKGNAIIFGDLTQARRGTGSCASSTRGLFIGGSIPGYIKTIDYVTTASTGNALTFGDLAGTRGFGGAAGSQTRALIAAGYSGSAYLNSIEYVTISSSGDAEDFGDLSYDPNVPAGVSDSHGGLGGF